MLPIRSIILVIVSILMIGCGKGQAGELPEVTQRKNGMARLQIQKLHAMISEYEIRASQAPESLDDLLPKTDQSGKVTRSGLVQADELTDPWGNKFVYNATSKSDKLHSMGPDGKSGTADDVK